MLRKAGAARFGPRFGSSVVLAAAMAFGLSACSGNLGRGGAGPSLSQRVVSLGQKVPKGGGRYKVGKPYQVAGKWFYPREDPGYDRVGIASWYGTLFHGRRTANGEVFDMNALTAAHPTLPLPSLVRVTNLRNGRSIVVRVNDRGPYKHNRIIDLSRYAAHLLDFRKSGTAQVRVTYLRPAPLNGDDRYERAVLASQPWMRMAGRRPDYRTAANTAPFYTNATGARSGPHQEARYLSTAATVGGVPGQRSPRRTALPLYVQVGVYRMEQNAQAIAARLRHQGPVRIDPVMIGAHLHYKVRLGPYLTRAQAQQGLGATVNAGVSDARIIPSPYQISAN